MGKNDNSVALNKKSDNNLNKHRHGVFIIMHDNPIENRMKKIANDYFAAWNDHDLEKLNVLFDEKIVLKDWDIYAIGIDDVLNANSNIFKNVPKIKVEVSDMAASQKKVFAELKVLIGKGEIINVVDILEFENDLITNIKAFKR